MVPCLISHMLPWTPSLVSILAWALQLEDRRFLRQVSRLGLEVWGLPGTVVTLQA